MRPETETLYLQDQDETDTFQKNLENETLKMETISLTPGPK